MKLIWATLAMERAEAISEHIALDKPSAAERWLLNLFELVERLEDHPRSGRKVPELDLDRIREVIHGAYRVIYSIDDQSRQVRILTVRRGSELLKRDELDDDS